MTVHFIGAGPGAADLITVRGLNLIQRCPVCLYAGSLVPREVVEAAPKDARVLDTAPMTLDASPGGLYPGRFTRSGQINSVRSPSRTSLGISTRTGPGRPVRAM